MPPLIDRSIAVAQPGWINETVVPANLECVWSNGKVLPAVVTCPTLFFANRRATISNKLVWTNHLVSQLDDEQKEPIVQTLTGATVTKEVSVVRNCD